MTTCPRASRNHFSPSSHMICFHTGIQTYSLQHHAFNSNANLIIYEIWYYNCLIIPLRSNSTLHPLLISNWDIFAIIWADSSDLTQIKRKYASHICLFEIKCEYKKSKYLFTFFRFWLWHIEICCQCVFSFCWVTLTLKSPHISVQQSDANPYIIKCKCDITDFTLFLTCWFHISVTPLDILCLVLELYLYWKPFT